MAGMGYEECLVLFNLVNDTVLEKILVTDPSSVSFSDWNGLLEKLASYNMEVARTPAQPVVFPLKVGDDTFDWTMVRDRESSQEVQYGVYYYNFTTHKFRIWIRRNLDKMKIHELFLKGATTESDGRLPAITGVYLSPVENRLTVFYSEGLIVGQSGEYIFQGTSGVMGSSLDAGFN